MTDPVKELEQALVDLLLLPDDKFPSVVGVGQRLYSKIRKVSYRLRAELEEKGIDAREQEAIAEGRKFLAGLSKLARANIECQMKGKLK